MANLKTFPLTVDDLEELCSEVVGDSPVVIRFANSSKALGIYECYKTDEGLCITVFEL
jgi:hypothetical protein